jgi:hypothetical protein
MRTGAAARGRFAGSALACWLAGLALVSAGEIVPAERRVDWTPGVAVGVPGGIPTDPQRQIDVTRPPYGADKTGVAESHRAIQAALDAASPGDVVCLPAGTYKLASTLTLRKSRVTVRGDGPRTLVRCVGGACFAYVGANSDYHMEVPTPPYAVCATPTRSTSEDKPPRPPR